MATDTSEDRSVNQEVQGVVQAAVDALGRAGSASAGAMSDAVEGAARSLTRRMVVDAVSNPRRVDDREALARALAARPVSPALAGATVAALGLRLARRFRRLGFLARRTPMWLVATAVPALLASVSRGADELGLVASNLVLRARARASNPIPSGCAGSPCRSPR